MPNLLDIPPELRNSIYHELLSINEDNKRCWPHLLATCRQINNEATKILYGPDNKLIISLKLDEKPDPHSYWSCDTMITIGKRQAFHILDSDGLFQTIKRWPRDLSRLEHVELRVSTNGTFSRCAILAIYQQLFVLSFLLANNREVHATVITPHEMDIQAFRPLVGLKSVTKYSLIIAGLDQTPVFDALCLPAPPKLCYDEFAKCMAVHCEFDDFLNLQVKAGMDVRRTAGIDLILMRLWRCMSIEVVNSEDVRSAREPREADIWHMEVYMRQIRHILGRESTIKIKLEAHERIAASSRS